MKLFPLPIPHTDILIWKLTPLRAFSLYLLLILLVLSSCGPDVFLYDTRSYHLHEES